MHAGHRPHRGGSTGCGRGRPSWHNNFNRKPGNAEQGNDGPTAQLLKPAYKPRRALQEAVVREKKKNSCANQLNAGGWAHSAGDVAFRDAILPSAPRRITRETLDGQIVATAETPWSSVRVNSVASLQTLSLRAVAENVHHPAVLEGISEGVLPAKLLERLGKLLHKVYNGVLPFHIWKRLAQTFSDLPEALKLYTDVVLDDKDVLRGISGFDASFSFTPSCEILTLLDLSGTALTKQDLASIRPLTSDTLVALRLDALPIVNDDAIQDLARVALHGETFPNLRFLSVRRCVGVTDRSAPHLARFHRLQCLDLRLTSCTSAFRELLRRRTTPPFVSAASHKHRTLFANVALHETATALLKVNGNPWKDDEASQTPFVSPPMLLVSELTRADETALRDPRDMRENNPFKSSHHLYGTVYTTRPISREQLQEVGADAVDRGEAFRGGREVTVQGVLEMGQTDRTWKKHSKAAKKAATTAQKATEAIVISDDSDIEDRRVAAKSTEVIAAPPEQPRFYQPAKIVPASQLPPTAAVIVPERDNLALVRFFASDGPGSSEFVQPKRLLETKDDNVVAMKKQKASKGTLDLLGLMDLKPVMPRSGRPAARVPKSPQRTESQVESQQSVLQPAKPAGITRNPRFTKAAFL